MIAQKTRQFRESIIRTMSLVCQEYDAINLAQGLPEDDVPQAVKQSCIEAIEKGFNQYARTFGIPELSAALSDKLLRDYGIEADPESCTTICCGGTEAMMAAFLATLDPGDEVLIPYPYYENYRAELIMAGAVPVFVPLEVDAELRFHLNLEALEQAITPRSKGLIINTPHNPTGKVFSTQELQALAELCERHNLLIYTDETYEHMVYAPLQHIAPASIPGIWERSITISSLSKSYSATGWRIAWAVAPAEITTAIRKVHDFLTISAPHPMQKAAVTALQLPAHYYTDLLATYAERRELICHGLESAGFKFYWPEGAYYVFCDLRDKLQAKETALDFSMRLVKEAGVGSVPGTAFMPGETNEERPWVRFSFCKNKATLLAGLERLQDWAG